MLHGAKVGEHGLIEQQCEAARKALKRRSVEQRSEPQVRYFVEEQVARAQREQRIDIVDRVGLGLSEDGNDATQGELPAANSLSEFMMSFAPMSRV